jgi:hypothetical protein
LLNAESKTTQLERAFKTFIEGKGKVFKSISVANLTLKEARIAKEFSIVKKDKDLNVRLPKDCDFVVYSIFDKLKAMFDSSEKKLTISECELAFDCSKKVYEIVDLIAKELYNPGSLDSKQGSNERRVLYLLYHSSLNYKWSKEFQGLAKAFLNSDKILMQMVHSIDNIICAMGNINVPEVYKLTNKELAMKALPTYTKKYRAKNDKGKWEEKTKIGYRTPYSWRRIQEDNLTRINPDFDWTKYKTYKHHVLDVTAELAAKFSDFLDKAEEKTAEEVLKVTMEHLRLSTVIKKLFIQMATGNIVKFVDGIKECGNDAAKLETYRKANF